MKFMALEKEVPGVVAGAIPAKVLEAEAAEVWRLYQAATIREIHYRHDRKAAVIILECAELAEAQKVIRALPLVRERFIDFEVVGLIPYRGYLRMFRPEYTDPGANA